MTPERFAEIRRLVHVSEDVDPIHRELLAEVERLSTCDVWVSFANTTRCTTRIPAEAIVHRGDTLPPDTRLNGLEST